ncbi:phospholipase B1, membrane-associated-like isoform X2 [Erinaceus europaeus]|uniref:Phospholipase B1, membrane-associated n=1 Tax=Erinaceus europaeus TaxID=9365 RepID=A0ABM3X1S3_ERIEU|nr:phospholipase B1, membrane-associated-like isoform X2 [Erinaceus europaeus]
MGLPPCVLLPGLLLLLGQGTSQVCASPEENASEKKQWPTQRALSYRKGLVILKSLPFSCNPKNLGSNGSSTSVHTLRPSDIKFVASIGNIETFHNSEVSDVEKQNRTGKKVCMEVVTVLSDIIHHFNPSVLKPTCTPGKEIAPRRGAEGLLAQAEELVRSMKENQQLDFQNDWKLINVFFSNSSHCHLCLFPQQQRFMQYAMSKLSETLDYLHQEVPKAYVNLIDFSMILESSSSWLDDAVSSQEAETCRCTVQATALYEAVSQWSYQETWEHTLFSSKYNQQDSFTLAYQPFFSSKNLPSSLNRPPPWDPTSLALHLWNSMMEPAGHKDEPFSAREGTQVNCPPQGHPYLYTFWNSNYHPRLQTAPKMLEQVQGVKLQCPDKNPSSTIPTSVHRLKPADIKVIAALGDSLIAANGAGAGRGNLLDVLVEFRGLSWSAGGDENLRTLVTLPNILREFNAKLIGYSTGTGDKNSAGARLNRAVSGAKSGDVTAQAKELVQMLQKDKVMHRPESITDNVRTVLDILHDQVPRLFVNLVSMLEIINLKELHSNLRAGCPGVILRQVCPCLFKAQDGSRELASLSDANRRYQKLIRNLVNSGRYDTSDDFTVVLQTFFERVRLPRTPEGLPDISFFAPDCFHFSRKAHAHSASALWNSMLAPIGQKTTQLDFQSNITLACPSQDRPFLRTYKNSLGMYGSFLRCRNSAPSSVKPTSVHSLRPGDINLVAALGDSLTAGSGIGTRPGNLLGMTTQFRGLVFSVGGDGTLENVTTLPNILRKFNDGLIGFAVCNGDVTSVDAFLDLAVPKTQTKGFLKQAEALVKKMINDSRVNIHDHWKIITVLIGNSDFCDFCTNQKEYTAEKFLEHVRSGLDYLQAQVPKALVNLVDFMSPDIMRQVFIGNPDCPTENASTLCNCVLTPKRNSLGLAALETLSRSYQHGLRELVYSGRYDTKDDFTVVLQPFFENLVLPFNSNGDPLITYFTADCLLPSQRLHTQLARGLWGNMMEPLGKKTSFLQLEQHLRLSCPNPDVPYLRTHKNSNYTYPGIPTDMNWGIKFKCKEVKPSAYVPTSVHKLQPADLKVVAAMGDWVTTAMGVSPTNVSNYIASWRGLSWSIGGDKNLQNQTTLPNILRKFNIHIHGSSTGTWKETAGLNVATEQARSRDLMAQVEDLIEQLENMTEINLAEDWKLITIFIGINDLCDYCDTGDENAANVYLKNIQQALNALSSKISRVFVNVVQIMDISDLYQNQNGPCLHPIPSPFTCPCFRSFSEMEDLIKMNKKFQSAIHSLTDMEVYHTREDFTVVVQPFLEKAAIPRDKDGAMDSTFFSEDCFHLSARTHDQMAMALWNNMLQPVGEKSSSIDFSCTGDKLICPTAAKPYLYTLKNSGYMVPVPATAKVKVIWWRFWVMLGLVIFLVIILVVLVMVLYLDSTNSQRQEEAMKNLSGEAAVL